jgi:hypothetical protein
VQLTHPRLLEFAIVAAWISTVAAAQRDLEELLIDVPPDERILPDFSTPWPWEFDSFVVALSVVQDGMLLNRISKSWSPLGWVRTRKTGRCFA